MCKQTNLKKFILTFIAVFSFCLSEAQLKVGSTAPNIILKDLNGVSHNLYNYLDSGVTVIFDIFATWCLPCKVFRNSHVFDSLELHYGMNGNITPRKVKIFSIESDPVTTTNSLIDWAKGNKYSYVEFDGIESIYSANEIPQFYVICPNRIISCDTTGAFSELFKESFWLAYTENCQQLTKVSTVLKGVNGLKVIPNPTTNFINIQFELTTIQRLSFHLIKATGESILYKEINPFGTSVFESIPVDNIAPGIYILEIKTIEGTSNIKVNIAP